MSQTLARTFVRKTLSNSDEEMLATDTLLFCSEECLSSASARCFFDFFLTASGACSPSVADQNVEASQLSSSLFDDKPTKFFIVQIAEDAGER